MNKIRMHPAFSMPFSPLEFMDIPQRDLWSMEWLKARQRFYKKREECRKGLLSAEKLRAECNKLINVVREEFPRQYTRLESFGKNTGACSVLQDLE